MMGSTSQSFYNYFCKESNSTLRRIYISCSWLYREQSTKVWFAMRKVLTKIWSCLGNELTCNSWIGLSCTMTCSLQEFHAISESTFLFLKYLSTSAHRRFNSLVTFVLNFLSWYSNTSSGWRHWDLSNCFSLVLFDGWRMVLPPSSIGLNRGGG